MKKFFCFILIYGTSVSAMAADNLRNLLHQAEPLLQREIQKQSEVPNSFLSPILPGLQISGNLKGAIAEYQPKQNKIYISRKVLKQWSARFVVNQNPSWDADILAQCLTPIYIHELSHASDQRQGQINGFSWPITIEDEFIASAWQLHIIQKYQKINPNYEQNCYEWLPFSPPAAISLTQLKEKVYSTYSRQMKETIPPPLSPKHIATLLDSRQIVFANYIYHPKHRILSLSSFLKKGGNWLYLSPNSLEKFLFSEQYAIYLSIINQREEKVNSVIVFPL